MHSYELLIIAVLAYIITKIVVRLFNSLARFLIALRIYFIIKKNRKEIEKELEECNEMIKKFENDEVNE